MNDADYKRIKDLYDALKLRGFHVATSRRKAFLYVLDNSTSIVSIDRLIAWLRDLNRGPAVTSFTEGPARQVAYALEDAIRIERETVAMPRPLPMRPLEKCSRCGFVQVRMADDKGAIPSTAADPRKLAAELRERINPAYADTLGTESHERRLCAEAIEGLLAQRDEPAEVGTDRGNCVRLDVGLQNKENDMTNTGTESLIALADDLESVAPNIEAWFDHTRAAALMRKAAVEIRRLAPLDPDIDVDQGEN